MRAPLRRHALKYQCLFTFPNPTFLLLDIPKKNIVVALLIYCTVPQLGIDLKEATSAFLPLTGITVKISRTNGFA